jgi:hypothetical protein
MDYIHLSSDWRITFFCFVPFVWRYHLVRQCHCLMDSLDSQDLFESMPNLSQANFRYATLC